MSAGQKREWTEPATVVIHDALMSAFEEWLEQRQLMLMGPLHFSEDSGGTWIVVPSPELWQLAGGGG